ncbi:MAG: hypothetical protein SAJ11_16585, partial [Jaaginema sp. PMC 1078.18]|nr:hypothetical protein [Jaaginema sp. PMC 1078.18]
MNELDIPAYLTISQATNAAYFLWLKPSKDYPYDRGLCNDIQVKSVKLSDLTVISPAHQEVECLHGELTLMSQKVISRSSTNFTKPCSCPVAIEFGDGVANKTYLFWCDDDGNGISYSTTNTLGNTWTTAISIQEKTGGQGTKEKTSPCVAVFENKLYLFWV